MKSTQPSFGQVATDRPGHSIYRSLFQSMILFGFVVGTIFPPFARVVLDSDRALSPLFFIMCICAGLVVGAVNYLLFSYVVSRELARISAAMDFVLEQVERAETGDETCTDDCKLEITSSDAIGDIEAAFNAMIDAISRRLSYDNAIRGLSGMLASTVEIEEVATTILKSMAELIDAQAGLLYADTGDSFELQAHFGVDIGDEVPRTLNQAQGAVGHALAAGKVIDLETDRDGLQWLQQSTPFGAFRPDRVLVVPLIAKHRATGVAVLGQRSGTMSADQHRTLAALRNEGAPYLQNAVLHRKIKDLAAVDDLTMILNRRFGLRRLREEFARSVRHGVPISVLLIDADNFKQFNDNFGHDAGDVVLRTIASLIEHEIRSGDVVCRYGGEEFMVVAPGTGLHDVAIMAERLRRTVQTTEMLWKAQSLSVTISLGIATWPMTRVSTSEELVSAADSALYQAKNGGRNKIAVQEGLELPADFQI